MRRQQPKPGQIGEYWPSKKPGREGIQDAWCRTWYDAATRQTRRVSLGTPDFHEATEKLAHWYVLHGKSESTHSDEVLIDTILLRYWEDHAKHLPSARTQRENLAIWQAFWGGRTVSEITPDEQRRFRKTIGEGRLKPSTIDKTLSSGRAALRRAVKFGMLTAAPQIFSIETKQQKKSRKPLGRPVLIDEMAKLFDAVQHRHLLMFLVIEANTLARPTAILEIRRSQYDDMNAYLDINPEGREQTNKFRPTVPVTPTLKRWLESVTDPDEYFVTFRGKPIKFINKAFDENRKRAGLRAGLTPYSFRHGISRLLRRRGVPMDQISHMLGHSDTGEFSPTTAIYAPFDPSYCVRATEALEELMGEVRASMMTTHLDDPHIVLVPPFENCRVLTDAQKAELRARIRKGAHNGELARDFRISVSAVYKHRKKVRQLLE